MPTQVFAGTTIDLDDEGFMTNPSQWTEAVAEELARAIGIDTLTTDHWRVIQFCRDDFAANGEVPTLRRITTVAGVPTKDLYQLFPKKPAKKVAFVSGLQKPSGCI